MVAADAERITLPNKSDAVGGVRIVSDDVAEKDDTVHILPGDFLQGGL